MKGFSSRFLGWGKDLILLISILSLAALIGFGFAGLMERGQSDRAVFSRDIVRAIADSVEASLRERSDVIENPVLVDFSSELQNRLEHGLTLLEGEAVFLPEVRVLLVYSDTVNALAFPGNLVVLYSGLLQAMEGPEELAGVLAHEIGHCVSRDSRNALIRELGISVLLGSTGGVAGGEMAGEILLTAVRMRYGRRAEKRADDFAVHLLKASEMDPGAYGRALMSLQSESEERPDWA